MKITWFATHIDTLPDGRYFSSRASTRFQCLIPAQELEKMGHEINIIQSDRIADPNELLDDDFGEIVVFIKNFVLIDEVFAERARRLNRRVIYSFCDFDFHNPELKAHRQKMAKLADQCVAVSEDLAEITAKALDIPVPAMITDPYEGPGFAARFAPDPEELKLVWFGNAGNLQELFDQVPALAEFGRDFPISVNVVAVTVDGIAEAFSQVNKKFKGRLELRFTPWSRENTWTSLEQGDLVLIPSIDNEKKKAKSPNRVVESLRNGRFVVAHPVSAYQDYSNFIRIDSDITAGLRWTMEHKAEIEQSIHRGQDYIEKRNSPKAVAAAWLRLLSIN
jgi:hypothetical protein